MDIKSLIWQDGWLPTTDNEVQELVEYLEEKKREVARLEVIAQNKVNAIADELGEEQGKLGFLENKINDMLLHYVTEEALAEDVKHTATQMKYKLLGGEIVVSKESKAIEKPKDVAPLMVYKDFIKTSEPTFAWGDFKKLLVVEDGLVKYDGMPVDVPLVDVPQKAVFKPKKKK